MQTTRQQDKQTAPDWLWSELFGETFGEAGDWPYVSESSIKDKDRTVTSPSPDLHVDFNFKSSMPKFRVQEQSVNTTPGIEAMEGLQLPGIGGGFSLPHEVPVQDGGGSSHRLSNVTMGSSSSSLSVTGRITIPPELMSMFSPKPSPPASTILDKTEENGVKRVYKRIPRARQDRVINFPEDEVLSDDHECDELLQKARKQGQGNPLCPFPGCIIDFTTTRVFVYHLRTVHNIERSDRKDQVKCLIPGCVSSCRPRDGSLIRHYKSHVVKVPCPYPHCAVVLGRVAEMTKHVLKVHGVTVKNGRSFTARFMR